MSEDLADSRSGPNFQKYNTYADQILKKSEFHVEW